MSDKFDNVFIATTDTVVGLGAPVSEANKKKIFELKKRPVDKNLIIMVGSLEQARKLKDWTHNAERYAKTEWPGPTTFVLSKNMAVRMPGNKMLRDLIIKLGPIYMTSANISGNGPLSFDEAKKVFSDIKNFYDFGKGSGNPSRIINIKNGEVIR